MPRVARQLHKVLRANSVKLGASILRNLHVDRVVDAFFWASDHWKCISGTGAAILVGLVLISPKSMITIVPSFSFLTRRTLDGAVRQIFIEAVEQRLEKQFLDRVVEAASGMANGSGKPTDE